MGDNKYAAACMHMAIMHMSDGLSMRKPLRNSPNVDLRVISDYRSIFLDSVIDKAPV